jgi:hypothetical protein
MLPPRYTPTGYYRGGEDAQAAALYHARDNRRTGIPDEGPPVNIIKPRITVNVALLFTVDEGVWGGLPPLVYAYQWFKDDVLIPAATNKTHQAVVGDDGSAFRCEVTTTNPEDPVGVMVTSNSITITSVVNTVLPVVPTTAFVGIEIETTDGNWTGNPLPVISYQWHQEGVGAIAGATSKQYTPVQDDAGFALKCEVTGTNAFGAVPVFSNLTDLVDAPPEAPSIATPPAISASGGLDIGDTLTLVPGDWNGYPDPNIVTEWLRNTTVVQTGGTTYTLQQTDAGGSMTVRETATNASGSASSTSNALNANSAAVPSEISAAVIVATHLNVGGVLSIDTAAVWDPGNPPYLTGNISPEAQAVLDRMSALTQTETDAIVAYVDGLVSDAVYDKLWDIWCPALDNANDAITGFKVKADTWLTKGGTNAHVPGQGWDFNTTGYMIAGEAMNVLPATLNGFLFYIDDTSQYGAPADTNTDYFGTAGGAGNDCYLRSRSLSNNNDHNIAWFHTSATARPPHRGHLYQDLCGWGAFVANTATLLPPGGVAQDTNPPDGVVSDLAWVFNGRNNNGTTQNHNNQRHSLWMFLDGAAKTDLTVIRSRSLTFLQAIGVTGVPSP